MMRNQRGISLIEVLIGVGIIGILTMAMTSSLSFMAKELKVFNAKFNLLVLSDTLRRDLDDSVRCKTLLTGSTITAGRENSISLTVLNSSTVLKRNQPALEYDLLITDLVLENPIQTSTNSSGNPIYRTELILKSSVYSGETAGEAARGKSFRPSRIATLYLETNASGLVLDCKLPGGGSSSGGGGSAKCDMSQLKDGSGRSLSGEMNSGSSARAIGPDIPNNNFWQEPDSCIVLCVNGEWAPIQCFKDTRTES